MDVITICCLFIVLKKIHFHISIEGVDCIDTICFLLLQSLGIIGSVPAGLLILTLLVLLLYLLTRCCDNRPRKAGSITCLKVTLVLFAILTL